MARARNSRMESLLRELGWSQEQLAARFRRVAAENGADELRAVTRSHVNQWLRGSRPGGRAPHILCETFSRGLGRVVTAPEIGLDMGGEDLPQDTDPVMALAELGSMELDRQRRQMLTGAAYSLAGLALATGEGPAAQARPSRRPVCGGHTTAADVAGAREMMAFFSRRDQRRGGGDGRAALVAYLRTDIVAHLGRRFPGEQVRREMFSTASELVYLCGWMSFDAGEHGLAQRYFTLSLHLAAEADDAPLAGHILRAMAHQAVDLGHPQHALALADASLEQRRYTRATPRERALLGVVHARSLAAAGRKPEALAALLRAENDLADATTTGDDPGRVWFFGEASLAHETACTLRDLGDLPAAEREFRRSVRTRRTQEFTRTHAVTLGYLGALQARQGALEAACTTWTRALEAMDGVQSGRARDTVIHMRRTLTPFRGRGISAVTDLDARAREVLARVG